MKHRTVILIAMIALTLTWATTAQALPHQTYVSSTGNDANDCTQATPCRTFSAAVPKTAPRGAITALDSSTYGIVTIDKALTIQAAPGVSAVLEGGKTTDAVTISAAAADVVVLRNLQLVTRSAASTKGIAINTVGTLHVESCIITGFGDAGIQGPSVCNESGCTQLFVIDTILRDNIAAMKIGSVKASIDHCRIEHNRTGILVQAQAEVTVRDCIVAGNSEVGLKAETFAGAQVEHCVFTQNGTGIAADSMDINGQHFFSSIYVSTTMLISNGADVSNNGGLAISFGNNRFIGTSGFTSTIHER